ncbi:MAG: hypothetical protein HY906_18400, partial [Deltaproteobacteria bacterium]|nr:hypothetical protein [Deltaproteobacteria bacterium]
MSEAHVKAVEAALAAIPDGEVRSPDMPIGTFAQQGEVLRVAAERDRADLLQASVDAALIDGLDAQLGAVRTTDAKWQVSRLQGRPQELVIQEQAAFALRDDTLKAASWALREDEDALVKLAKIREGDGVPDMLQDHEALAAFLRTYAPKIKLQGFDPGARATECEEMARVTRAMSAKWKLDESQRNLLQLRDRAFTLCAKTLQTIRGAAEFKFGKDEQRIAPYRDRYTMARTRRSR